ncbi:hypothetical protein RBWH47_01407 [Rhodopirellula baltica WH47]|uniref:Uncharacterized protein n=1 Tax=Rhodopirellula baltica WH47 TaxID=991778 RepID=F2AZB4_RHOBT|nr:hypothetical protein RBWH47_01407 [Rhodopirellula baltica WH47]
MKNSPPEIAAEETLRSAQHEANEDAAEGAANDFGLVMILRLSAFLCFAGLGLGALLLGSSLRGAALAGRDV